MLRVTYYYDALVSPNGKPSYYRGFVGVFFIRLGKDKKRPALIDLEKLARRLAPSGGQFSDVIAWNEVGEKEVPSTADVIVWEDEEIIGA